MKVRALCGAVTLKVKAEQACSLSKFVVEAPKTKDAAIALKNIGLEGVKTLVVL